MTLSNLNQNLALVLCLSISVISSSFAVTPSTCFDNTPGHVKDRYTDLGDGSVLDTLTGLIWERCNLSQTWSTTTESCLSFTKTRNWRDSLVAIQNYNANQFALGLPDNWRMPNIKELSSIIDLRCVNYALDGEIFPNAETVYWSSTPNAATVKYENILDENGEIVGKQDENFIWIINTLTGREEFIGISDTAATMLVRNPVDP